MQKTITIIGAGLAGLAAAYQLQKMGYATTLYEARNRPGGRVYSVKIGDSYEELGGKSLRDGGDGQRILALIYELGLETEAYLISYNRKFVYHNQIFEPANILKEHLPAIENITEACNQYVKSNHNLAEIFNQIFPEKSVVQAFMQLWARNYDGSEAYMLDAEYIHFYLQMAYKSALANKFQNHNRTEFCAVEGGNSRLIAALVAPIKNAIYYSHQLIKISKLSSGKFSLIFKNGQEAVTDYLLLTIPATTLREVQFPEDLFSADQLQAIHTQQYGTNSKILFPIQLTNPSTELVLTDNVSCWFNHSLNTMTFYYGGVKGLFNLEKANQLIQHELPIIKTVYPNLEFPYGTIAEELSDDPGYHYQSPVAMNWSNEPFSKGSYSNYGPGQYEFFSKTMEEYGEVVREVFRSTHAKIFFAGEHTDVRDAATLEGAVVSGEKAARMIYKAITG